MSASDTHRVAMLARIRASLGVRGADPEREAAVQDRLKRHPRGTIPARAKTGHVSLLRTMTEMLESQGAEVTHVSTPIGAVRTIARDLAANGLPLALRMGGDPRLAALPWQVEPGLILRHGAALPEDKASLSRAVVAAAETGTLFLVSGPDNPTTLAFLPETHFILVDEANIVGCYEEAFDRLRAIYGEGKLPRSVNMVSGPSRTADIEQTIVRGAHGPKRLNVLILA
jgi:L-lactate dehydrogenase complex protein LldG